MLKPQCQQPPISRPCDSWGTPEGRAAWQGMVQGQERPKAKAALSIQQAVNILNGRRHRDCETWIFDGQFVAGYDTRSGFLDAFEAVAVAEKYQAESGRQSLI